ncbi:MAG: tetratricopeptide repeat protein, partial [Bacteroidetes bacterium]|nr:tetratricopeptide repeat protein [Bacteroidota bacterium]
MKKLSHKNFIFTISAIFFLFLFAINSFAQTSTDEQLAAQYLQNKEYDKAVELYEKLFNKNQEYVYYAPYVQCLTELKNYKAAEKIIKKQIKLHSLVPQYGV